MKNNQLILFQGDSITDCGRDRAMQDHFNHNGALGSGYASHVAAGLLADFPARQLRVLNRGISGNRVVDLYARWKSDAVNLKPDIISILIGVNDTWHEFSSSNGVELDRFEKIYRMLLEYTRQRLGGVQLVLCEPFVLPCGVVVDGWPEDIAGRQKIVAALAGEFDALHVPFQEMFNRALEEAPAEYWAGDGVHPSPAGHARMAQFWRSYAGF